MTSKEVMELGEGSEVYWTDPDNGECSGYFLIECIEVEGEEAQITTCDGRFIECPVEELSL